MRERSTRDSIFIGFVALFVIGAALYVLFGRLFVSKYPINSANGFLVLLPIACCLMLLLDRDTPFNIRFPTPWVRWLAWPLLAMALAGFLGLTACGWVAGASRLIANESGVIETLVVKNAPYDGRRSWCAQQLTLAFAGGEHSICADKLQASTPLKVGKTLLIKGPESLLGIHAQSLESP
jgi:hypothetical protein